MGENKPIQSTPALWAQLQGAGLRLQCRRSVRGLRRLLRPDGDVSGSPCQLWPRVNQARVGGQWPK
eukprot:4323600-Alexandrium_andersonii.AAC.1